MTAGRWPWKSESAKECVTTHLPNEQALKMDETQVAATDSGPTSRLVYGIPQALELQQLWDVE